MLKKIWEVLKPFHKVFGWFVALLVVYEGLQIVEGYVVSLVVRLFGDNAHLFVWISLFVGLVIYDEIFMRLDNALDWHIVSRHSYPIYKYLKLSSVKKFLKLDISWHQQHNSGALVGKVSNGVWKVLDIADALSWEFVPTIIQTILSLLPIIFLSPLVGLVAIMAFLIFGALSLKSTQEKQKIRTKRHDRYESEWHKAIEMVQSVETAIMFGQIDRLIGEQEQLHSEIMSLGLQEGRLGIYKYNRARIRILNIARRAVLLIWIFQLYTGTLDIANLIFLSVLTEKLFHSFWRFARLFDRAAESGESGARLANLLTENETNYDLGEIPVFTQPVDISLNHVCFSYSENYALDKGALHDLTLEIPGGNIVALVGPSGAGKTTIRKIITRLIEIQSGTIEVGGLDIRKWKHAELLKLFSYVPQGDDVAIFAGSVKENIAFPQPHATIEEIEAAAKLAGIHEFVNSLPEGYQTLVGERGKRLSGGQKQRIALARAILADRPILILDEATSAVDAITEREIQSQMGKILKGKTAIIIAHRLSTIWDIADKIVVLDNGRIVEEGSHAQLIRNGSLYAKMVHLQTAEL